MVFFTSGMTIRWLSFFAPRPGLSSASSFEVEKWSQFPCQTTFSVWIFPLNCKVACSIICGRIICGNAWSSRAPMYCKVELAAAGIVFGGQKYPQSKEETKKNFLLFTLPKQNRFWRMNTQNKTQFYRIAFDALFSHGHVHEISSLLNYLGDHPLIMSEKDWVSGSRKWPVLLNILYLCWHIGWVVGSENVQYHSDVIHG